MTHLLFQNNIIVFSTREFALNQRLSLSGASHQLKRLSKLGHVHCLTRGIWIKPHHPYFSPFLCVAHLLGNEQGYVSFLSALYQHNIISQIPARIQIATTGHSRKLITSIGSFEFYQIHPMLMSQGIIWSQTHIPYRIACPEKALFDTLYLSTRKQNRFSSLPETDTQTHTFKANAFIKLVKTLVPKGPIQKAMFKKWENLNS